ncbi:MAG: class I SAM-dependent methyltransferase [Chloroflexia bacterium]|nr:class I SAM-dependent methyltransferase [Chloroflexia bacterium]
MLSVALYDDLGADYDRFVDWPARLALELPALEGLLAQHGVRRVLDAACGSGRHALALAQRGYEVVGADLSAAMIKQSRRNARVLALEVPFYQVGLGELSVHLSGPFDAVLCLGQSLPHLLSAEAVAGALEDFAALLPAGGLLLIQNRNDERLLAQRQRFLPLSHHREGDREWLFLRMLDFAPERITFHLITLRRDGPNWQQRVSTTVHRPIPRDELVGQLRQAGFADVRCYGSWRLEPFDRENSGDLVVVAQHGPGS